MDELKDRRIVIIEDNVMNMAVYAVALKQSGALAIQDPFNTDTLNLIKRSLPIDVILLDLMLRHHLNGYEIFDQLRADPELTGIPVIAVSAADPAIEMPRAKEMGFAGFISKPIDPFLLVEQIAACIDGQQVWYTHEDSMKGYF